MIKLIKSTFFNEKSTAKELAKFITASEQLSFGEKCEEFEWKFARWQKCKHVSMLNSGSSANLALIQALLNLGRLKKGDKVGFSAVTWSTNVMPLIQLGLEPVAIDVELDTLNVSLNQVKLVLKTHKLKAIFITNLLGFCDDIDQIQEFCQKQGIILIEDNCESMGTVYKDRKLGSYGLASTFSFYVGHHMSTIEGGAVCTNDEELDTMVKLVRAHGWDRNLHFFKQDEIRQKYRVNSTFYSRYTFYDLGYNLRPTEINGFLGIHQLKFIDKIVDQREKNFFYFYDRITKDNPAFYPLRFDHLDLVSNFAYPIICKDKKIKEELVKRCKNKIEIRPVVGGDITRQPFFSKYSKQKYSCPNARLIHQHGLYFGNSPEYTKQEKELIVETFQLK